MLDIQNLSVSVDDKQILKGVDLTVKPGEVHAIMGPNGSGKSTLAYALAGHPSYVINGKSKVTLNTKDLLDMSPDQRAQAGLFLAFQYPVSVSGVSVQNFLKTAYDAIHQDQSTKTSVSAFRKQVGKKAQKLGIDAGLLKRSLNQGFSGGEKKRVEILQLSVLNPKIAILDETDSGLDIDSIKIVAKGIKQAVEKEHTGCIVITHYQRILDYLDPDYIHVMIRGKITKTGGPELVSELETKGYQHLKD